MKYYVMNYTANRAYTLFDHCWWLWPTRIAAITINSKTVWVKRSLTIALTRNQWLLNHEAGHIEQAHRLGWKYLPTYVWCWIKAGFRPSRNAMEIEAYAYDGSRVEVIK